MNESIKTLLRAACAAMGIGAGVVGWIVMAPGEPGRDVLFSVGMVLLASAWILADEVRP